MNRTISLAKGVNSEQKLINMIARRLAVRSERIASWIGDDAAVVGSEGDVVTTIDAFVDGVHFHSNWPMAAIGHKAMAATISDIAAMGATPGEAFVALGIDRSTSDADVNEIYSGMEEVAEKWEVTICGGDLTRSEILFIAVSVNGWIPDAGQVVTRSGAKPDDLICVTGCLGGAGAGLKLLEGVTSDISTENRSALIDRQQRPEPQVELGLALAQSGATSMIDLSDGLATDARHLAEESGVTMEIELERLPLQEGVNEVAAQLGLSAPELAAQAGEDFELLTTVSREQKDRAERTVQAAGGSLTWIGSVSQGEGRLRLTGPDSAEIDLSGFDHFGP